MLLPASHLRLWLYTPPTDMRKSFDGLCALVRQKLEEDPVSGQLFVFINRRRTQMKVLYFEQGGYCIWSKRLEAGLADGGSMVGGNEKWRRGRDSNPGTVSRRRFSRPVLSTTQPPLLLRQTSVMPVGSRGFYLWRRRISSRQSRYYRLCLKPGGLAARVKREDLCNYELKLRLAPYGVPFYKTRSSATLICCCP